MPPKRERDCEEPPPTEWEVDQANRLLLYRFWERNFKESPDNETFQVIAELGELRTWQLAMDD